MTLDGLAGKRVLITGAGGGLGAAIAEVFGHAGAVLGLHAFRSEAACRARADRLRAAGGKAEVLVGDLRDPAVRAGLVDRFVAAAGGIDVLVNNAGGAAGARHFLELDEAAWDETFALNALGPFALARAGAPHGILVNVIRPGVMDTPFHAKVPKADWEARLRLIPLGRAGAPDEVAQMAAYLASDAGRFITGQVFAVSGGE